MKKILTIDDSECIYQLVMYYPSGEKETVIVAAKYKFTAGQIAKGWLMNAPLAEYVQVFDEKNEVVYSWYQVPKKPIKS